MKLFLLPVFSFLVATVSVFADLDARAAERSWLITEKASGLAVDTATGVVSHKGIAQLGLVSVKRKGGHELVSYWEPGGFRQTLLFDGRTIVDGKALDDVSRISSVRFDRTGSMVHLRTTKGPKATVDLLQDGRQVMSWPRLSVVRILSYRRNALVASVFDRESLETTFWSFARSEDGLIEGFGRRIGAISACTVNAARVGRREILMDVYCDPARGSDVIAMDMDSGALTTIAATGADEFGLSVGGLRKGAHRLLSVTGSEAGRQAYHSLAATILSQSGEPASLASDEAGTQSWNQSYRTRALGELYGKTGHEAFAQLARRAIGNTLGRTNRDLGMAGMNNASCAWASRIYSTDRRTPISFMINQAMISSAMIQTCKRLGSACGRKLSMAIDENAQCLVKAYEPLFDRVSGLYRIPYGVRFRFDGLPAPWNWQMNWAAVLDHVGRRNRDSGLTGRAQAIAEAFLKTWQEDRDGALWRYWPQAYYAGWTPAMNVSLNRPSQKPRARPRHEDLNHAGLSLLGLADLGVEVSEEQQSGVERRLDWLLAFGAVLPRDMDGKGPRSPRWLPGAGWHVAATSAMRELYSRHLPNARSGDQHLAYALLFDPKATFALTTTELACDAGKCRQVGQETFGSLREFITDNIQFSVVPAKAR